MKFSKVLVTTDFSEESLTAVRYAAGEVSREGGELAIITVVPDTFMPVGFFDYVPNPAELEAQREQILAGTRARLQALADKELVGLAPKLEVVSSLRSPAEEISEFARSWGAHVIVMGSRGSGALGAFVLGSVVQKTLQLAPCPLLVLPKATKAK